MQALLALQPPLDLSVRDLCPPGHTWLPPAHRVNVSYSLPPAMAAAAVAAEHYGCGDVEEPVRLRGSQDAWLF